MGEGGSIRTGEIRGVDWSRTPANEATVDGYLFIEDKGPSTFQGIVWRHTQKGTETSESGKNMGNFILNPLLLRFYGFNDCWVVVTEAMKSKHLLGFCVYLRTV